MEINLENKNKVKMKQLSEDKQQEEYDKFYRKEEYKVSLINVDSSFRNKSPKNIYSSAINYLPKDPISVKKNSSIIEINYPNHGFKENDRIIIQNVEGRNFVLSGDILLFQSFQYCFIKLGHNYNSNYTNLLNKLQVEIEFYFFKKHEFCMSIKHTYSTHSLMFKF